MSFVSGAGHVVSQTIRFLTFQNAKIDEKEHGRSFFLAAILFAWIAGIGRYWDHPDAAWWQYAGLGSVLYIFFLSTFLFLIVWPLKPKRWSWLSIFIFVGLTSPLAWLYAIPVEQFLTPELAIKVNVWFLAIVAIWRVALYAKFLWSYGGLRFYALVAALLAPLSIIVMFLGSIQMETAAFEIMAGIEAERTPTQERASQGLNITLVLMFISVISFPIWFVAYVIRVYLVVLERLNLPRIGK